ncbi:MAG: CZB domain-containing protein, partial [Oscillospiraceae bacterium]
LFKLNGTQYAVYSKNIAAIVHISDDITIIPEEDKNIRGIMTFRQKPIKLIDMRILLSIASVKTEFDEFKTMIDDRKKDHEEWIESLEYSIKNNVKFEKATDPHKCKLGQWLDSFETTNNTISHHLNKIIEPHNQLHETALTIFNCHQQHDSGKRIVSVKSEIKRAKEELVPEVLELLDETKLAFKELYKEMAIVFEKDDSFFGIIVDEVLSVDALHFMDGSNKSNKMFATKYIFGVGKTKKSDALVLLLNENKISEVCKETEDEAPKPKKEKAKTKTNKKDEPTENNQETNDEELPKDSTKDSAKDSTKDSTKDITIENKDVPKKKSTKKQSTNKQNKAENVEKPAKEISHKKENAKSKSEKQPNQIKSTQGTQPQGTQPQATQSQEKQPQGTQSQGTQSQAKQQSTKKPSKQPPPKKNKK